MPPTPSAPARSRAPVITVDLPCANCGYNLRGLDESVECPECGRFAGESVDAPVIAYAPAQVRWARLILLGVTLWLAGTFSSIGTVLIMPFSEQFGGSTPRVNYIGPKVPAVSLMQRGLGYSPGPWGTAGVTAGLMVCVGIVLLTSSPTDAAWQDPITSLRFWARYVPLLLFGGFLGLTMGAEGVHHNDPQVRKFILAAVAGVELPATVLLYWHMSDLSRRLGVGASSVTFARAAVAVALLMIAAVVVLTLGQTLRHERHDFPMQLGVSVYMAVSVCVAATALGALARVVMTLLPIALHRVR